MKIIRNKEVEVQNRPDGRIIRQLLKQSFNSADTSFIFVEHPANFAEKQHKHERCYEVFYFLDNAEYKINGEVYDVEKGDLVVFEPGDVHGAVEVGNKVGLFIIQIPPTEGDKVYLEGGK